VLSAGPGSIPVSVVSSIRSIIGGGANDGKAGATLKVGPTFRGAILFAVAGFGAVLRLGAEVFVFGCATAFTVRSGAAFRPARGEDLFTGLATDLTVRLAAAFFALRAGAAFFLTAAFTARFGAAFFFAGAFFFGGLFLAAFFFPLPALVLAEVVALRAVLRLGAFFFLAMGPMFR